MKSDMKEQLASPSGVTVTLHNGVFHLKGPKGEVSRELHMPRIVSKVEAGHVVFSSSNATQREKRLIMTFMAHLQTAFKGVQHGHNYKLKICASHFPMTVTVKGNQLEIKNFFGEQVPRHVAIPQGVTVKVDGQVINVDGVSRELTGQTAANIEHSTKRAGFDKRIFQDGIFMIEKDGKSLKVM